MAHWSWPAKNHPHRAKSLMESSPCCWSLLLTLLLFSEVLPWRSISSLLSSLNSLYASWLYIKECASSPCTRRTAGGSRPPIVWIDGTGMIPTFCLVLVIVQFLPAARMPGNLLLGKFTNQYHRCWYRCLFSKYASRRFAFLADILISQMLFQ